MPTKRFPDPKFLDRQRRNLERGILNEQTYRRNLTVAFIELGHTPEAAEHYADLEAKISDFKPQFDYFLERLAEKITNLSTNDKIDSHQTICLELVEEFLLLDEQDRFPIWLSRIVAGALEDHDEG